MRGSDRGRRVASGVGVFVATAAVVYGLVAAAEVIDAARAVEQPRPVVVRVEAGGQAAR